MIILFKIWCTCLVLTIPVIIMHDMPKRRPSVFDVIATLLTASFLFLDVVLLFVLMIMAIWS